MLNKNQLCKTALLLITLVTAAACLKSYHSASTDPSTPAHGHDDDHDADQDLFCAVMNPSTGTYIDLSQLSATPNRPRDAKHGDDAAHNTPRWLVPDAALHTNFTLSVCSAAVAGDEPGGLPGSTGAYYVDPATQRAVSIGDFSSRPRLSRARKLTLQYDGGAVCPNGVDRKATLLSFACDREVASAAKVVFVGSMHECAYFFEVRSVYACPTSARSNEVNVVGIFVGIFAVFFLVEYGGRRWLYAKVRTEPGSAAADGRRGGVWGPLAGLVALPGRLLGGRGRVSGATGAIRLRSHGGSADSREAFLRDMERQNEVMDALEVASNETDAARSLGTAEEV